LPVREALLKHNLFKREDFYPPISKWVLSENEKDELIQSYKDCFFLVPKGTRFISYQRSGREIWFSEDDSEQFVEYQDGEWAKQNLTNIKKIKYPK
jgi:hypothetical protein